MAERAGFVEAGIATSDRARRRARIYYMAYTNLDEVRQLAKDLAKEKPRSAHDRLGGFELAARALDKCRATLVGTNGDYEFNCPLDQRFFKATGIDAEEFRAFVATGADDEAVDFWITEHAATPV